MRVEATAAIGLSAPLIEARHLRKCYSDGGWFSRNRPGGAALDDVSLSIDSGTTLALVGESGAGKSTLGRCMARLTEMDSGTIQFRGRDLSTLQSSELFSLRRQIQFIFQDSATAMNSRFSAVEIVAEPLRIQDGLTKGARHEQSLAMMECVGLPPEWADRGPYEFSGGERQRLAIARALVLKPSFLILDEALSGLDVPIQAQIANLLMELQASFSLTYLFISHDLRLAAYLADRIAVMQRGRIVESGAVLDVLSQPKHPHTRELIATIPEWESQR